MNLYLYRNSAVVLLLLRAVDGDVGHLPLLGGLPQDLRVDEAVQLLRVDCRRGLRPPRPRHLALQLRGVDSRDGLGPPRPLDVGVGVGPLPHPQRLL